VRSYVEPSVSKDWHRLDVKHVSRHSKQPRGVMWCFGSTDWPKTRSRVLSLFRFTMEGLEPRYTRLNPPIRLTWALF